MNLTKIISFCAFVCLCWSVSARADESVVYAGEISNDMGVLVSEKTAMSTLQDLIV